MRTRSPRRSLRATPGLFGLWVVGLCALCLSFAEHMSEGSLTRWQLGTDAGVLMSCAEEPSSRDEPLWCANPDSPHCTRGTPAPSSSEPGFGPMLTLTLDALGAPRLTSVGFRATLSPAALLGYARAESERLERPPRTV